MIYYDLNNCNIVVGDRFLYKRINAELLVRVQIGLDVIFASSKGEYTFTRKKIFDTKDNIPRFDLYTKIRKI